MKNLLKKLDNTPLDKYIIRLLSAWCLTAVFFEIGTGGDFKDLKNYSGVGMVSLAAVLGVSFVLLSLICFLSSKKKNKAQDRLLPVCFAIFSVFSLMICDSFYFAFVLVALWAVLIFYYVSKGKLKLKKSINSVTTWLCIGGIFAAFAFIACTIGALRYKTYTAPNFDFGIFCHMFRNMKESFLPVTTCERDGLLSHFAVHVSPIFYVLLPLYCIFPSPVTLQISQGLIVASAVIPLALIARKYHLSNAKTIALSIAFMFHPAIISGTNYDIHENCFLLPLLLWVFWAFETNRFPALMVFTALTLAVKEDAAVYILFFALYVFFARRKSGTAITLAVIAAIYFCVVLYLLKTYGNGVMSNRYKNYLPNGGTLIDVVRNMIADPAYVFTQLFLDKEGTYSEKILFILQIMVPFAFLPFATKKVSNLILLLPMLLLNLMTVYLYQYDIGFQYHFGVMAFLAYLTVINLSQMTSKSAKTALTIAAVASLCMFFITGFGRFQYFVDRYTQNRDDYKIMDEALAEIPEEASVISSTFLAPHLTNRDEIYEDFYHKSDIETDYVILDARHKYEEYYDKYSKLGYTTENKIYNNGELLIIIMTKGETA